MTTFAITVLLAVTGWLWLQATPRYGLFTPVTLFATLNCIMGVGTLILLDGGNPADVLHGKIIVITAVLYALTVGILITINRNAKPSFSLSTWRRYPVSITPIGAALAFAVVISLVITFAYYYAVGQSAFLASFSSVVRGEELGDVATMRLEAYAGERYLFPGYVNQFKNALLPALLLVMSTSWIRSKRFGAVAITIPIVVLALLGTGQRGALVMFLLVATTYVYWLQGARIGRVGRGIILSGVLIFLFATLLAGRASIGEGVLETFANGLDGVYQRIFYEQQNSSLYGFRYIYELPTSDGGEWVSSFLGLLPGISGSTLSNDIFAVMYGSNRGTAPPSIWGSLFLNFGLPGVVVLPSILAALHVAISERSASKTERNTLWLVGMSGVYVTVGTWVVASPDVMMNAGLAVYVVLWVVGGKRSNFDDSVDYRPLGMRPKGHLGRRPKPRLNYFSDERKMRA